MRKPFILSIAGCLLAGFLLFLLTTSAWISVTVSVVAIIGCISYGASQIRSGFFLPMLIHGNKNSKNIALTFDDGPEPGRTEELLQVLDKHNIKGTFFIIGKKAVSYKNIVRKIAEKGHFIGNHTFSHSLWFDFWSSNRMRQDIALANTTLTEITGQPVSLFRPPYGVTNPPLAKAVRKNGLTTIGWSIRTMDTVKGAGAETEANILDNLQNGDIILLHDTTEGLADMLDRIIPKIKTKGFTFVTINQMTHEIKA